MPGGDAAVDLQLGARGDTLILLEASMIVGANVAPNVGSIIAASRASIPRRCSSAPSGSAGSSPTAEQERARRVGQVVRHAGGAEPLDVAARA